MTAHPVESVYVNGVPVAKADVRAYEKARGALVLATSAEIQTLELPTTTVVGFGGMWFRYDASDTTSNHDGIDVLVSFEGRRYKRIETLDDLSAALILALLGPGGLPIDRIAPGPANTLLATLADLSVGYITGAKVADILDAALGSVNWRTGVFDIAIGSLVKRLPANASRGMIGGRYRLVQMGDDTLRVGGAGTGQVNGDPGGNNIGQMRRLGFPQSFVPHPDGKFYAGLHAGYAIDADGYPWSWGDNSYGALGHGNTTSLAVPKRSEWFVTNNFKVRECVPIMSGSDPINYGCYFLEDGGTGRVAYAGYHGWGAAGDGSAASGNKTSPVIVSGLTNVTYLTASCNPTTALARRSDGSWRGWGANDGLCLGIAGGSFTSPQVLGAMAGWVKAVCAGKTTLALTDTGAAKTAGENTYGNLGVGNTSTLAGWQSPTGLGSDVIDIACNQEYAACLGVIQNVGGAPTVKLWGFNATGQVGDGTTTQRNAPYAPVAPWQGNVDDLIIAGQNGITANVGATFVRSGNRIYAAGYNGALNLSVGIAGNVSSFVEVLGHVGDIVDWAVMGYYSYYGLIVLTDKGCFSGGSHSAGDAAIGPTLVNAAELQDLWVTTVMGPAGQNGQSFGFDQIGLDAARPSAGSVPNGWRYVATDTSPTAKLYVNQSGTWSPPIPVFQGLAGADGKTVLSGSGAPGAGLGNDGDYYINTTGYVLYGPKTAGAWGAGTNMIGAPGSNGTNGTNGLNGVFTGTETIETSIDNADWLFFKRASDNAYRRVTRADFLTGVSANLPPNFIFGLTLSNNTTDANNDIDIAVGKARDGANTYDMTLASIMTKRLDATWAAGTNQGGLDTGSKANSTWYFPWLIRKDSDGSIDVLLSASATAPTMPSGYTAKRRLGAVRTNASGNIIAFIQRGNRFLWVTPLLDVDATSVGTSAVLRILSVPAGLIVEAMVNVSVLTGSVVPTVRLSDPAITDQAPLGSTTTPAVAPLADVVGGYNSGIWGFAARRVMTNTSAQIRSRASQADARMAIMTEGWIDPLGAY